MAKTQPQTEKIDETPIPGPPQEPPAPQKRDAPERGQTFWAAMKRVSSADWGARANIYLYRIEPITDRLRGGDKKYVMCYAEPISEDRIMTDQGSGRYKAILTFRKPASQTGDEIDAIYFDILNPRFPPKIPPGEWLDDPRNKKWAWAKQYVDPPAAPPSQANTLIEAMQAVNEIRRTTVEETRQNAPAAPATDPMLAAMTLAEKLLTIRADNPMVTMMSEQLTAMRAELATQRARSDSLMDRLSEKNNAPAPTVDPLTAIKSIFDTFKSVRAEASEIMPSGGGRSRLGPWMEFFQPVLPSLMDLLKPVAAAVAQQAMQPNPANGPQRIPQAAPPQQQDFGAFLDLITPRMIHFLREYENPAPEFAAWLHDGWGETAQRAVDTIASMGGVPALIGWYKTSKYWPTLAPIEQQFTEFLNAVIAWHPEADEPEAKPPIDATAEPVIDLESEPAETN